MNDTASKPIRTPDKKWNKLYITVAVSVLALIAVVFSVIFVIIRSFSVGRSDADTAPPSADTAPGIGAADDISRNNKAEVRGIYIATVQNINYPSKKGLTAGELRAELDDIVATCTDANLNAIYFQVRPSSDALYKSDIFPTSEYVTGKQGEAFPDGFDPLGYLIDAAHAKGIAVHAWVNPLRVTVGSASAPKHDTTELAESHPARKNPEYVVPYADGRLYFDCGQPQVRKLIADGVAEIVKKYAVDGVIFDDYFYPYPVSGALFDDSESYEKYGNGMSEGDWRRDNVNQMIEECYNAIKAVNVDCKFGVAPFGIWQNDDGENGGSDTSGLESYSAIYCDPLAWIKGGYIDYIAPQIYWRFTTSAARFDVLTRWWNTAVDGSDVDLLISHGIYNYDTWENPENELRCQVEFARAELGYKGSILYGYAALKNNSKGLFEETKDVFKEEITYTDTVSNGRDLIISIPYKNSYIDGDGTFVIGTSDPSEPLYIDEKLVGRTKSGYFSLYLPLHDGKNTFIFTHKGKTTEYVINRGTQPVQTPDKVVYPTLPTARIAAVTPSFEWMGSGTLPISVTAPRGAKVTATLDGVTVKLTPTLYVPYDGNAYMKEVYTGSFNLTAADGTIRDLGKIKFTSLYGNVEYTAESANIRVAGKGAGIPIEILGNDTEMKIAYDSWYYDDYTPQSAGMRDNVVSISSGFYKLRCGGYVSPDKVRILNTAPIKIAAVSEARVTKDKKATYFKIKCDENIPVNCYIENGEFCVTIYNIDTKTAPGVTLADNPLFTSVRGEKSAKANSYKYWFKLVAIENFYGFDHYYEDGYLVVECKNPEVLPDSDKPLFGKTIILDAGHGGKNPGALGPLGAAEGAMNESDFNLEIVMAAEVYLKELGATVVQIRDRECEIDVPIADRMQTLIDIQPDLMISIHQNSMPYTSDITKIRGVVGLYWSDSGYMLTDIIGESIAIALNKLDRSPTKQRLAMVRNPKFPSTLVETCFITSVEEYERMMKADAVDTIAKAIADGVLDYYEAQRKYLK